MIIKNIRTTLLLLILMIALTIMYKENFVFASSNVQGETKILRNSSQTETNIEIFEKLNKNKIHTGILYDKIIPFSGIDAFTGDIDSQEICLRTWKQIFHELKKASLADQNNQRLFPSICFSKNKRHSSNNLISTNSIAIINVKYNSIKSNAIEKGLLTIDEEGYLVENKLKSKDILYEEKRVFAASAMDDVTYYGSEVHFKIDQSLYISNTNENIEKLEIDFNDNYGFRQVDFEDIIKVNYTQKGLKTLKLKATLQDQTMLISKFSFRVKALTTPQPHDTLHVRGQIEYAGGVATGKAYIYTTDKTPDIRNPVIVVEGFDPENTRNWEELYDIVNKEHLAERLRSAGHDLIILNFDNGADYIQRNAFLLLELIKHINGVKSGEKQLVVIGASMGGLVSRYALAYMEKNNISHNTRLFISFDSPQQGANIPIGIQYWLDFFKDKSDEVESALDQIDSVAAKQMLVIHYNRSIINLRSVFSQELSNIGYPNSLRKIAISNGSGHSVGQSFQAGDKIIEYETEGLIDVVVKITGNSYAVLSSGTSHRVFKGKFWQIGSNEVRASRYVTSYHPYDNAPGGMTDSNQQIANGDPPIGKIKTDHPNHCFIPTTSSLDIDTQDLFHNIANDSDILNKTPFDAIYYPKENENHITITKQNSEYFFNEIHIANTKKLTAYPLVRNAPTIENTVKFNVEIQGEITKSWTAQTDCNWLTITDVKNITQSKGSFYVKCDACRDCIRSGIIYISAIYVENSPVTVTVNQGFENVDFYWVGNSGNWSDKNHWATSSGGHEFHSTYPTINDNVYFDEKSFTIGNQVVNIDSKQIYCKDMDWTDVQYNPTFPNENNWNKKVNIFGSLKFSFGMNLYFGEENYERAELFFMSQNESQVIRLSGKKLSDTTFDGNGGWVLNGLFEGRNTKIRKGKLKTNNYPICSYKSLSVYSKGQILLGESAVTTEDWSFSGEYIDSRDSEIKIIGEGSYRNGLNSFNSVTFFDNGTIKGNNYFNHLIFSQEKDYVIESDTSQTVLNIEMNGNCKKSTTFRSSTEGKHFTVIKSEGEVDAHHVVIKDSRVTGGATFTTKSTSDAGNNTGWTFTQNAPRNLFWVGGSGNWDDINHWKYIKSNGEVIYPACTPTFIDNVYFDEYSFNSLNQKVVINVSTASCKNMDWSQSLFNPILTGTDTLKIHGSLILNKSMDFAFSGKLIFLSSEKEQIIQTVNRKMQCHIVFSGSGEWTLHGDLDVGTKRIQHYSGLLDLNNNNLVCEKFISDGQNERVLLLGNSFITADEFYIFPDNKLTFDAGTSSIHLSELHGVSTSQNHSWPIVKLNDVVFQNSAQYAKTVTVIDGNFSFNEATFYDDAKIEGDILFDSLILTSGKTYYLGYNNNKTINSMLIRSECQGPVNIRSTEKGKNAKIISTAENIIIENVAIQDVHVSCDGKFIAKDSVDLGSNSGWEIQERESRKLYWVGGGGMWTEIEHWSLQSGGIGGECPPTPVDDVYFDSKSFSSYGEIILNAKTVQCRNMDCTGLQYSPVFNLYSPTDKRSSHFEIYGSIKIIPEMKLRRGIENSFSVYFKANKGNHTISIPAKNITTYFQGKGEWKLENALDASYICFEEGTLISNNMSITCSTFRSTTTNQRKLYFNSSKIYVEDSLEIKNENLLFDAGTSSIFFTCGSDSTTLDNIRENSDTLSKPLKFHNVSFLCNGKIIGNYIFDQLNLAAGKDYILSQYDPLSQIKSEELYIISELNANSECFDPITIEGRSKILSNNDIYIYNVVMKNIQAEGKGNFSAINSTDLGNNSGWNFIESSEVIKDLYWIGGTGDWNDTSHWSTGKSITGNVCVPSRFDNVYFNENSFTEGDNVVNMKVKSAVCRNMNWKGSKHKPVLTGCSNLNIHGSLNLIEYMDFQLNGKVYFTGKDEHVIATANQKFEDDILFIGQGRWVLLDQLNVNDHKIYLNSGSLITNDKSIVCEKFLSPQYVWGVNPIPSPRSLSLGNSKITIYETWEVNSENLNFDAGTSLIQMLNKEYSGKFKTINSPLTYYNVLLGNDLIISGDNIFYTLTFLPDYEYDIYGNQSIIYDLIAKSPPDKQITIDGNGFGININNEAGTVEIINVSLSDLKATGGAEFVAINSSDLGGNYGWVFVDNYLPRNLYWIGGSGNWNDPSHWSLSSGGECLNDIPTELDNVYFDSKSFSKAYEVVTINVDSKCKNMDWTSAKLNPILNIDSTLNIFGNLFFTSGMSIESTNRDDCKILFMGSIKNQTITIAGNLLKTDIEFKVEEGVCILLDDLNLVDNDIHFTKGSLNTNNKSITCRSLYTHKYNHINLYLQESILYICNLRFKGHNIKINPGKSTIKFHKQENRKFSEFECLPDNSNYSNSNSNFDFYKIIFFDSGSINSPNISIDTLILSKGKNYQFNKSGILIKNRLEAKGTCSDSITMFGSVFNNISYYHDHIPRALITQANGSVEMNHVLIKDIHVSGEVPFIARNSSDLGNNNGWTFTPNDSNNLYWVNGTGDWNEPSHWSYSSGGASGACIPDTNDNVYFDEKSFTNDQRTIHVYDDQIFCKDMIWSDTNIEPVLKFYNDCSIILYGSLKLTSNMEIELLWYSMDMDIDFLFKSDQTGNKIDFAGKLLKSAIVFNGSGEWVLEDSINTSRNFFLIQGTLNMNNQNISCASFYSNIPDLKRKLLMNNSEIRVEGDGGDWEVNCENLTLESNNSLITFTSKWYPRMENICNNPDYKLNYNNILFENTQKTAELISTASYNSVTFNGPGKIYGNNIYNNLCLNPGKEYRIQDNTTQTIQDSLNVKGNCWESPVYLQSYSTAYIEKLQGKIEVDCVVMQNINCIGDAIFIANNSMDLGGNHGWRFENNIAANEIYWVNGAGSWSDPYHWSFSSGGEGGACLPTVNDNVYFDENSFFKKEGQIVTIESGVFGFSNNLDWTGANSHCLPSFINEGRLYINGSLTLIDEMDCEQIGSLYFCGNQENKTLITNNRKLSSLSFVGGGEWFLQEDLHCESISLDHGTLNTNNKNIYCNFFGTGSNGIKKLALGSSTITTCTFQAYGTNLTVENSNHHIYFDSNEDCSRCVMSCSDDSPNKYNKIIFKDMGYFIFCGNSSFDSVIFEGDAVISSTSDAVISSTTFNHLKLSPGGNYQIWQGNTINIISSIEIDGDCKKPIVLISIPDGEPVTIFKSEGTVLANYLVLQNIHTSGGATFKAFNSVDLGNNDGWLISSNTPKNLFWVGGSGNWNDSNHWSLYEGGQGGGCIPTAYDNILFNNSPKTITLNTHFAFCKDIVFSSNNPEISFKMQSFFFPPSILYVFGEVRHNEAPIDWLHYGIIFDAFELEGDIDGNGEVDLSDAIITLQLISSLDPECKVFNKNAINSDRNIGIIDAIHIFQKCFK